MTNLKLTSKPKDQKSPPCLPEITYEFDPERGACRPDMPVIGHSAFEKLKEIARRQNISPEQARRLLKRLGLKPCVWRKGKLLEISEDVDPGDQSYLYPPSLGGELTEPKTVGAAITLHKLGPNGSFNPLPEEVAQIAPLELLESSTHFVIFPAETVDDLNRQPAALENGFRAGVTVFYIQ
ncbi:hypothetical protein CR956_01210 [Candidatus Saccharibacteria bacterium]|nr:MAG: hypothetical protein CR956_01210 [Candidatus Saccharibacteria bacterium]